MKKIARLLVCISLPMVITSCSSNEPVSLEEEDSKAVRYFCSAYSNFAYKDLQDVLDIESNYLLNVSVLNEKYTDDLNLKQLDLVVQSASEYVDWVNGQYGSDPILSVDLNEEILSQVSGNPPSTDAKTITSAFQKSCDSFE